MKGFINGIGAFAALIGWAGIAEAVTGQGSFAVSMVVFAVGFAMCLATMKGESDGRRS